MSFSAFSGLDLLVSAVVVLDADRNVLYANPAAENLFEVSVKHLVGQPLDALFSEADELIGALAGALATERGYTGQNFVKIRHVHHSSGGFSDDAHELGFAVTPIQLLQPSVGRLLVEFRPIDQQLKLAREERLMDQQDANRHLIRNLAHEIKNPLGGIRGSAQLLERELKSEAAAQGGNGGFGGNDFREYTQVIIKEADRLQGLMDRLLTPHRPSHPGPINIHEVIERVRTLLIAEYPEGILIRRDYDTSLPEFIGDKEQLIQVLLNIGRNAAQAMKGKGEIVLRTRIARHASLGMRPARIAIELSVIDNGPGIDESIRDKIFYPLVSGREGGSGLGLTLAQTFVQQHHGVIEVDSRPGFTCFRIRLPFE